jgi:hypothetical protein
MKENKHEAVKDAPLKREARLRRQLAKKWNGKSERKKQLPLDP